MKEPEYTKLPVLTRENLPAIMKERLAATRNPKTSIPALWQGLLEIDIGSAGGTRPAKLYVPKDTPQGTAFVLLNVPEGETACDFLNQSGWIDCADKHDLCLFAAEPQGGGWTSADEELPYLSACLQAIFDGVYIRGGMSAYIVGYGAIGGALHRLAMENPLKVAAAAFFDASDIDDASIRSIEAVSLDGNGREYGIDRKEIPVPVLMLESKMSPSAQRVAQHWARAMGAGEPTACAASGLAYRQARSSVCTPEGNIAQVVLGETSFGCLSADLTAKLCGFLTQFARFGKDGPFGNTLVLRPDYQAIGAKFLHFTDANGHSRECLVYVPKAWQNKGKLPLVLALHGAFESVRNYFEESLWYRKADSEGFIVVMPEGLLKPIPDMLDNGVVRAYRAQCERYAHGTTTSDLGFIDKILDAIIADYPVDESRIYCTGHSMGCMMTNFACSSFPGRRFAAAAATSGILGGWDPAGAERVPMYMTMGQYDLWSSNPRDDSPLTAAMDQWLVRQGLANEENAKQVRGSAISERYADGRYDCYVWKNPRGIPVLRYDCVQKKDHMNTPEENFRFWDLWFSKWILDPTKGRCYEGTPIESRKGCESL